MSERFSDVSKSVGWEPRRVSWPTLEEVSAAGIHQLLTWYRFLPSPETDSQIDIITHVTGRFQKLRKEMD